MCQKYAVTILEVHLFETGKESFSGYFTAGCRFFFAAERIVANLFGNSSFFLVEVLFEFGLCSLMEWTVRFR